jgi:hypothetical protein
MRLIDADVLPLNEDENGVLNGIYFVGRSGGKTLQQVKTALTIMISNAPTVDAKPVVHAHWVQRFEDGAWVCSRCRSININIESDMKAAIYPRCYIGANFCPECGAVMDERP